MGIYSPPQLTQDVILEVVSIDTVYILTIITEGEKHPMTNDDTDIISLLAVMFKP